MWRSPRSGVINIYAENARSFLFKRNTDVELDLSNDMGKPPSDAGKTPLQTRAYAASRRTHSHEQSEVGFTQMLGRLTYANSLVCDKAG